MSTSINPSFTCVGSSHHPTKPSIETNPIPPFLLSLFNDLIGKELLFALNINLAMATKYRHFNKKHLPCSSKAPNYYFRRLIFCAMHFDCVAFLHIFLITAKTIDNETLQKSDSSRVSLFGTYLHVYKLHKRI